MGRGRPSLAAGSRRGEIRPVVKSAALGCLFLLPAPALGQDVMRYHVRHITVLAEDANTRVLRYAAKAGDRTPMHSHPASVVYVIKGGRVKITLPDGSVTITTVKAGTDS